MTQDPHNPDPTTDFKGRSISFYHPNSKGTGSALRLEPRLNRDDNDRYNCFFIEMAPQKSLASRGSNGLTPATFDWTKKITVKLGFLDIAELLTVMEGRAPKVGGERNGLYHASGGSNTMIAFLRNPEQGTYYFSLSIKRNKEEVPHKIGITLSEAEVTGLRCLFQTGLFFITFSSMLRGSMTPHLQGQRLANREAA
jgi:Whirly transcription factor